MMACWLYLYSSVSRICYVVTLTKHKMVQRYVLTYTHIFAAIFMKFLLTTFYILIYLYLHRALQAAGIILAHFTTPQSVLLENFICISFGQILHPTDVCIKHTAIYSGVKNEKIMINMNICTSACYLKIFYTITKQTKKPQ